MTLFNIRATTLAGIDFLFKATPLGLSKVLVEIELCTRQALVTLDVNLELTLDGIVFPKLRVQGSNAFVYT